MWSTNDAAFQVEKVFSANHPDPAEVEKAKKVLRVRSGNFQLLVHNFYCNMIAGWNIWFLTFSIIQELEWTFVLQEHEQALVQAIARLEEASDGESGNA